MRYVIALLLAASIAQGAQIGGVVSPDGKEYMQCDLPARFHQKNSVGRDGSGLCVFASMRHSGIWGSDPVFEGIFDWMKKHPGGGYPSKVDAMLTRYCGDLGVLVPQYVQSETADLGILKLACRNRYMPAVTYLRSPTGRYGGGRISHMVSLVHATDNWFAVLDNNYVGGDKVYEWMTPKEFHTVCNGGGRVWSVVLLSKVPPPRPRSSDMNALVCAAAIYAACPFGCSADCSCGCNQGRECRCATTDPGVVFGVETKRLSDRDSYRRSGRACSRREVLDTIDAEVPDYSDRRRVVLIGDDAGVAKAAIGSPPWAVVSSWGADDWRVKERGFQTDGGPVVYVLEPDGLVFHRQSDAEGLAGLPKWGDPKYPDRRPAPTPAPTPAPVEPAIEPAPESRARCYETATYGAAGGLFVLILREVAPWLAKLATMFRRREDPLLAEVLRLLRAQSEAKALEERK